MCYSLIINFLNGEDIIYHDSKTNELLYYIKLENEEEKFDLETRKNILKKFLEKVGNKD